MPCMGVLFEPFIGLVLSSRYRKAWRDSYDSMAQKNPQGRDSLWVLLRGGAGQLIFLRGGAGQLIFLRSGVEQLAFGRSGGGTSRLSCVAERDKVQHGGLQGSGLVLYSG